MLLIAIFKYIYTKVSQAVRLLNTLPINFFCFILRVPQAVGLLNMLPIANIAKINSKNRLKTHNFIKILNMLYSQ